jgi:DNA-binding NtrC family response regulator
MTAGARVLIVDDQAQNLDVLVNHLAESGLELAVTTSGEEALDLAARRPPELVLLDVMMPGLDGYALCRRLKAQAATREVPVILISALADTRSKVEGFAAGAIDFLTKPLQRDEVLARINAHLTIAEQRRALVDKNRQLANLNSELQAQVDRRQQAEDALRLSNQRLSSLSRQQAEQWGIDAFVGQSVATAALLDELRNLQQAPRTNVIVLGESGTGKELVSRAIHFGSTRSNKPFVAVNCASIPAELADAEFFGHVKGAYTGATGDRHGHFVNADGGTLFLDEIGDMPPNLQAKLLRVLEDGIVLPIGGHQGRRVDVRVVAATHVDIRAKVQQRSFRSDLYFRLAGYVISLPPLRERAGDIPLLVDHWLRRLGAQMGRERPAISAAAMAALSRYHYPGNVRELKNLIEFALIASRGKPIEVAHLHFLGSLGEAEPPAPALPAAAARTVSSASAADEEQALLDHARTRGRIDNAAAQSLLQVDHGRASYMLKKLHREGQLVKHGDRRWTHYKLA